MSQRLPSNPGEQTEKLVRCREGIAVDVKKRLDGTMLTRRRAVLLAGAAMLGMLGGARNALCTEAPSPHGVAREFSKEGVAFTVTDCDVDEDGLTATVLVESVGYNPPGYSQILASFKVLDADGFVLGEYEAEVVGEKTGPLRSGGTLGASVRIPVKGAVACGVDAIVETERFDSRNDDRPQPFETLLFGNYPQSTSEPEPIEWLVLEEKGEKKLLLAKNALDRRLYNDKDKNITWENCTLRSWLNSDFLTQAFSMDEQSSIIEVYLKNEDNELFGTEGGNDTYDKVFLLSLADVEKHFGVGAGEKSSDLICCPTDRSLDMGAYLDEETGGCIWWLRSTGLVSSDAANVLTYGSVSSSGSWVVTPYVAVRPALWVSNL